MSFYCCQPKYLIISTVRLTAAKYKLKNLRKIPTETLQHPYRMVSTFLLKRRDTAVGVSDHFSRNDGSLQ